MIRIYNDKKEKHNSWEAHYEYDGDIYCHFSGYGPTESSAMAALKIQIEKHICDLKSIDYEAVEKEENIR